MLFIVTGLFISYFVSLLLVLRPRRRPKRPRRRKVDNIRRDLGEVGVPGKNYIEFVKHSLSQMFVTVVMNLCVA